MNLLPPSTNRNALASEESAASTNSSYVFQKSKALVNNSIVQIALGVVMMSVLAQIVIPLPFTPVPLSLGTMGALLLGVLFSEKKAAIAATMYAAAGALGAPILAGFMSGFRFASFGYVIGYIAVAVLASFGIRKFARYGYIATVVVTAIASFSVYIFGTIWMVVGFDMSWGQAVSLGVLPFLFGDLLKSVLVAGIVMAVNRRRDSW